MTDQTLIQGIRSLEALDLTNKINRHYVRDHLVLSCSQQEHLKDPLREQFVEKPTRFLEHPFFWDSKKSLDFLHVVGEYLDKVYHSKAYDFKPLHPVSRRVNAFIHDLNKLNVTGWRDELPNCILVRGAKSRRFHNPHHRGATIGLISCVRNCETYWDQFNVDDLVIIMKFLYTLLGITSAYGRGSTSSFDLCYMTFLFI
ncbi:uncharacterized protein LOC113277943 [Papaver somniferum]|uniref:uncharacterized protein LOC113277943 n=1 Tax=Papaver somniferum TaxID=3469 RepID=UPI000E70230C|nr:uncharacterized protein LOC113277943 [Papaver somniferum]